MNYNHLFTSEQKLQELADTIRATPLFTGTTDLDRLADKQLLFLVVAGLKPAAEVASGHMERVDNISTCKPDRKEDVEQFLKELGIAYSINTEPHEHLVMVNIARTWDELVALQSAQTDTDIGRAMGYPDTAVTAFTSSDRTLILSHDEAQQLALETYQDPAFAHYSLFHLSQAHALDELKVLKGWYDALKQFGLANEQQ